jgi:hypothetical protein
VNTTDTEPNLVQVIAALPEASLARREYHEMRRKWHNAELSCSMTAEENQRLKAELAALHKSLSTKNMRVAGYTHGSSTYAVVGSGAIEYVNLLRGIIRGIRDATMDVVPDIPKEPVQLRQDQLDAMNEFGGALDGAVAAELAALKAEVARLTHANAVLHQAEMLARVQLDNIRRPDVKLGSQPV